MGVCLRETPPPVSAASHVSLLPPSSPCSLLLPGGRHHDRRHHHRRGLRQRQPAGGRGVDGRAGWLAAAAGRPAHRTVDQPPTASSPPVPPIPRIPTATQGDVRFAEVMGLMGAKVEWSPYSITITGAGEQHRQYRSSSEAVPAGGGGWAGRAHASARRASHPLPAPSLPPPAPVNQAPRAASSRRLTTTATTSPTPP